MECIFEGDDAGTPGMSARDLDGILDRLGAGIHQEVFFGNLPGVMRFSRSASRM